MRREEQGGGQAGAAGSLRDLLKTQWQQHLRDFEQIKSQARQRICWSLSKQEHIKRLFIGLFLALELANQTWSAAQHCTSFTLHVPHHELILLCGNTGGTANKHYKTVWTAFVLVQHSHNTPNQRKQPPKHVSGGPSVCVRGWMDLGGRRRGSFYSYI